MQLTMESPWQKHLDSLDFESSRNCNINNVVKARSAGLEKFISELVADQVYIPSRIESYAQKMFIIEPIITYDVNLKQFL